MNNNYRRYNRRSIRLRGYDYSQSGLYFVTICCQNKMRLFGEIMNGEMILNDAGLMIEKWYHKTAEKFQHIRCLESVVMPDHFHCIWQIVGADPRVCPNNNEGEHAGSPQPGSPQQTTRLASIPTIVQWFKTMTTNEYIRGVNNLNWTPFYKKMWQRNYYEHIIRNENAYNRIAEYITNNPLNWDSSNF